MSLDAPTPGTWPRAGASSETLTRDHQAAVHAYVVALDRILSRSGELGAEAAMRQLAAVPPPEGPEVTGPLLERKRRELLERFDLARHQHVHLPGVGLEAWLRFFFAAAEMTGSGEVTLDWRDPALPSRELVPVAEGARYRAAAAGRTTAQLAELAYVSADGKHHAVFDAASGWLMLGGAPWLFKQVVRELDQETGASPLELLVAYDFGRELQEGAALAVRLLLRNHSDQVIVLEDLATDHAFDPREKFKHASLGRLAHDPVADRYTYDAIATGITDAAFRTAVIGPGQERALVIPVKLLQGGECWRSFTLRYHRLAPAEFQRRAYVPLPGPIGSFPPRVSYGPLASLEQVERFEHATVLLAGEPGQLHTARWAYPFHVGRRAFSLQQALGRLSEAGEPVHYSRWQQAWVMAQGDGAALVSPSRVTPYPRVDPRVFIVIDEAEQRVPLRFHEDLVALFRSLPLGITDWESHALGLSVSLPKLKLTSFFQEIERLDVRLGLDENLLGRRTLWIEP